MKTALYEVLGNGQVRCLLCPNRCLFAGEGQVGRCRVRMRLGSKIENRFSGIISSASLDPIEKKPLYHFNPGSTIYSIGFYGCTLGCTFCQNHSISQTTPPEGHQRVTPETFSDFLSASGYKQVAFTYSEPLLYAEWIYDSMKINRSRGIKNVLITNGYINPAPAADILEYTDALNIDIKSFNDGFYKNICSGQLQPVLDFITLAFKNGIHMELTNLVITDLNDSIEENTSICKFISGLSPEIPFHLSAYYPAYRMKNAPTDHNKLIKLAENAKKHLKYVYCGNIGSKERTICSKCGKTLITRENYMVNIIGLDKSGNCSSCGHNNKMCIT